MSEFNTTSGNAVLGGKVLFRQECLFWCTAAVLLVLYLWSPFYLESEVIHAEITREMMVSGNWFHPALNWQVFADRPGLSSWVTLPFAKLLGFSEFALRIPSVLAALGALYVLRLLGRKLFSEKIASISCWLFLGSAGFLIWGRSAAADMVNTLIILLAVTCCFKLEEKRDLAGYFCFYLLCFGGALFNNLTTLVTPLLLLGPMVIREKKKELIFNRDNLFAFLFSLTLYVFYFYVSQSLPFAAEQLSAAQLTSQFPEMLWSDISRWIGHLAGFPGSWHNSGKELLFFLLPWTPVLPVGIAGLLKNWKNLPKKLRTFFISLCSVLFLYTFFGARSFGALLPLLPLILLFCAAGFGGRGVPQWNHKAFSAAYYFCIGAASLCICSFITYPLWDKIADCTPPAALIIGPVAAGLIGWLILFMDHRNNCSTTRLIGLPHRLGSTLFAGTILSGCAISVMLPVICKEFETDKRFFIELHREVAERSPDKGRIPVVSFAHPVPAAYLFYNDLDKPVALVDDLELLIRKYPGRQVVILMKNREDLADKFTRQCNKYRIDAGKPFLAEEVLRWRAPDSRNDSFVAFLITLPRERSGKNG